MQLLSSVDLAEIVSIDPDVLAAHATDWTGRWSQIPAAVVQPTTVREVALAVQTLTTNGVPVTIRGGNTGLVGGAVPLPDGVVLTTAKLNRIGDVTPDLTITVGAGVTLEELEAAAKNYGLTCGLRLASGGSATVGGAVSTNAGGARVVKYGSTRNRVRGLRAVLPDGGIIDRRGGLIKDQTGYALSNLIIGAEGTLGVVTDVTWQLESQPKSFLQLGIAAPDVHKAMEVMPKLREIDGLEAVEWIPGKDVPIVVEKLGRQAPLPTDGLWLIVEITHTEADVDILEDVTDVLDEVVDIVGPDRLIVAQTDAERQLLWQIRENMTEAVSNLGVPLKLDVAVPVANFAALYETAELVEQECNARVIQFGHFAEANFHINVLGADGHTLTGAEAAQVEEIVLSQVLRLQGTVSAEHGIGRLKRGWLPRQRGAAELAVMSSVHDAINPTKLLNLGVLLP